MNYWVTTHWPNLVNEDSDEPHYGIYIPDGRESAVKDMNPGDIVFIYESKTGRTERRRFIDGSVETIPCHTGKEGIVTIVSVESDVFELEESEPKEYTDGSTIWWRFFADTECINSHGFIPRELLNEVLGYKLNNLLRGFGEQHSGVKVISNEQAEKLIQLYNLNINKEIDLILKDPVEHSYNSYGQGGEGDLHKKIKNVIADDPSIILNEPGLIHIKTEFGFITGDRVDILLKDRFGRFVVVEVEPECSKGNDFGAAQCMKYRSLMAFQFSRREEEVRTILAAPIIDDDIKEKAKKYGIEPVIVAI